MEGNVVDSDAFFGRESGNNCLESVPYRFSRFLVSRKFQSFMVSYDLFLPPSIASHEFHPSESEVLEQDFRSNTWILHLLRV